MTAEICTSMFHWDKERNTLSQEISTLEASGCENPFNSEIYDCGQRKEGFKLMSSKFEGKFVRFVFERKDMHHGEVYGWWYRAVNESNTVAMGASGIKLLVIND